MARPRRGDLEGRDKYGELDGVNFSRLLEGVAAIVAPLTHVDGFEENSRKYREGRIS